MAKRKLLCTTLIFSMSVKVMTKNKSKFEKSGLFWKALGKMTEQSHPTPTTPATPTLKAIAAEAIVSQESADDQPHAAEAEQAHDGPAVAEGTESAPEDDDKMDRHGQLAKAKSLVAYTS